MRGSRVAAVTVAMVFTTLLGWSGAVPATASPNIEYRGRGTAAKATISSTTTAIADTGELASSGGSLEASSLDGAVSGSLVGDTLHASTIGQGDRTRSEASLGSIGLTAGVNTLSADLVMSRSSAVKHGSTVDLSATSYVNTLIVNGLPVVVTGLPNQTVSVLNGQLVINEQSTSTSGTLQTITVNALHLTSGDVDLVLGTSKAGVSTGSSNCSSSADHATGGGWLPPAAGLKKSFGFVGGERQNGSFYGHLVFHNHQTDQRVSGVVTDYARSGTVATMSGSGEADGQPTNFTLEVTDGGEPSVTDEFDLTFTQGTAQGTLAGGNIQVHEVCA